MQHSDRAFFHFKMLHLLIDSSIRSWSSTFTPNSKNLNYSALYQQPYISVFLLLHLLLMLWGVEGGGADFLVTMETSKQSHLQVFLVGEEILQTLAGSKVGGSGSGVDDAVDLCRSVGAHYSVGLRHLHSWHKEKVKTKWSNNILGCYRWTAVRV